MGRVLMDLESDVCQHTLTQTHARTHKNARTHTDLSHQVTINKQRVTANRYSSHTHTCLT